MVQKGFSKQFVHILANSCECTQGHGTEIFFLNGDILELMLLCWHINGMCIGRGAMCALTCMYVCMYACMCVLIYLVLQLSC